MLMVMMVEFAINVGIYVEFPNDSYVLEGILIWKYVFLFILIVSFFTLPIFPLSFHNTSSKIHGYPLFVDLFLVQPMRFIALL